MEVYNAVEQVLKENEGARDNDFVLVMNVLVKMGFAKKIPRGIFIEFKDIEKAPAFETITRRRRKIQNDENRLLPSEKVEEARRIQSKQGSSYQIKNTYVRPENQPNSWMMN